MVGGSNPSGRARNEESLLQFVILGIILATDIFWNLQHYSFINRPYLGLPTATPTPLPTTIPLGTLLPAVFNQTSWKTYTSPLGVSFAYPPDFRLASEITPDPQQGPYAKVPTIIEIPDQHLVSIDYAYSYFLSITKITSQESVEHIAQSSWATLYETTFNGYLAILSIETPEFIKNAQVPENVYYVKAANPTVYKIEYAIPSTSNVALSYYTPEEKARFDASIKQQNDIFQYIPQILGSINFL